MEDSPAQSSAQFWPAATSAPEQQQRFTQFCMLQSGHPGDGLFPEFPVAWTVPWSDNSYGVVGSYPMPAVAPTVSPPPHPSSVDLPPQFVRPESYAFGSAPLHDVFPHGEHIQGFVSACDWNGLGDGDTSVDVWPFARNEEHLVNESPLETALHSEAPAPSISESRQDRTHHEYRTPAHDPTNASYPDPALDAEDPQWKLSLDTYTWIFAVMYPKRRPNKKERTPSGQCRLCPSVSRRPGILQQHLTVLHRQRLARKVLAGHQYNAVLALAFVVAQLESYTGVESEGDLTGCERSRFKDLIAPHPLGQDGLDLDEFPLLHQQLTEFSARDSWMGVKCKFCGMLATRPVALAEHANVCAGASRASQSSDMGVDNPTVKSTTGGRAPRPSRATR